MSSFNSMYKIVNITVGLFPSTSTPLPLSCAKSNSCVYCALGEIKVIMKDYNA